MLWGKQAANIFSFGNGTQFTMPFATWNHVVNTINQNSGVNVYVNSVLTVTETILYLYPIGTLINPGIDTIDRGRINRSIFSLHKPHNRYINYFKTCNRVLPATDVNPLFTNSYVAENLRIQDISLNFPQQISCEKSTNIPIYQRNFRVQLDGL
jgi:hypothetical protein